jgi:hypothetical protein
MPVSEVFTDNMLILLMAQNQKLPNETEDIFENPQQIILIGGQTS